jgi:hypothetical protein
MEDVTESIRIYRNWLKQRISWNPVTGIAYWIDSEGKLLSDTLPHKRSKYGFDSFLEEK